MTDPVAAMFERPHFSIGRVLEDSCETLIRTFPLLLGIAAIVAVPLLLGVRGRVRKQRAAPKSASA